MTTQQTRITAADEIAYNSHDDTREVIHRCGVAALEWLNDRVGKGKATFAPGLVGWGTHTHTMTTGSRMYHVTLSD